MLTDEDDVSLLSCKKWGAGPVQSAVLVAEAPLCTMQQFQALGGRLTPWSVLWRERQLIVPHSDRVRSCHLLLHRQRDVDVNKTPCRGPFRAPTRRSGHDRSPWDSPTCHRTCIISPATASSSSDAPSNRPSRLCRPHHPKKFLKLRLLGPRSTRVCRPGRRRSSRWRLLSDRNGRNPWILRHSSGKVRTLPL
jgi:hypothetical protein